MVVVKQVRYIIFLFIVALLSLIFTSCSDENVESVENIKSSDITITSNELDSLIESTPDNGVLDLGNKQIIIKGKPVDIEKNITIKGGVLKRAKTSVAVVISLVTAGSKRIVVANASIFKEGDWVAVVNPNNKAINENSGVKNGLITNVTGNVITLSNVHEKSMPVGSICISSYQLIRPSIGFYIVFDGVTFDGNKQFNDYTHDWSYNGAMTIKSGHIVRNCNFKDMPSDNIHVGAGAIIEKNTFSNLNGSFVHFSNPNGGLEETIVRYNTGDGICQAQDNGHNEGAFTFSNNSSNLLIIGNSFKNGTSCYGIQTLEDININVNKNVFENFDKKINLIEEGHLDPLDISSDIFINVPR